VPLNIIMKPLLRATASPVSRLPESTLFAAVGFAMRAVPFGLPVVRKDANCAPLQRRVRFILGGAFVLGKHRPTMSTPVAVDYDTLAC
jgi:hypothetical protein